MSASTVALQNAGKRVDSTNPLPVTVLPPTAATAATAAAVAAVDAAPDKVDTFTYAGSAGAYRISTIVHSSASLSLSYTETFAYLDAGTADERISTITRS